MYEPKQKVIILFALALIIIIIAVVIIIFLRQNKQYKRASGFIFNTAYNVTYQSNNDLSNNIFSVLSRVDSSLSVFNKESVISRINRNETVMVDKPFTDVFVLARHVSEETGGAFDITVAPLVNLWGFGFENGESPTRHKIDSVKAFVGYNKVSMVNRLVQKTDNRIILDCGGIAKGYGCDVVANLLRFNGIQNFLIEIGGEIVASGVNENDKAWKVGVAKPVDGKYEATQNAQTVLSVINKSMATSGNYRNYYYKAGKKVAHTINPVTGYPVQRNILSATVLADNCAMADAYATAFMVLGLDSAKKVLKKHPEISAYLICSDADDKDFVWYSPSVKVGLSNYYGN